MIRSARNKVAVVTGGASGVGRGIAEALLEEGAQVVIADVEKVRLERTARELSIDHRLVDVADPASVEALADYVRSRFGTAHIMVNNAGVGAGGPMSQLTLDDWRWMIDVNLWGVIHGVNAFLPMFAGNPDGGHFVNTASMSGLAPLPLLGPYAVAKSGVIALSEALAAEQAELATSIGCTVLCLGPTRSDIADSQRNRPQTDTTTGFVEYKQRPDATIMWREPREIGRLAVEAIYRNELFVLSHPEQFDRVERRHDLLRRAAGLAPHPIDHPS